MDTEIKKIGFGDIGLIQDLSFNEIKSDNKESDFLPLIDFNGNTPLNVTYSQGQSFNYFYTTGIQKEVYYSPLDYSKFLPHDIDCVFNLAANLDLYGDFSTTIYNAGAQFLLKEFYNSQPQLNQTSYIDAVNFLKGVPGVAYFSEFLTPELIKITTPAAELAGLTPVFGIEYEKYEWINKDIEPLEISITNTCGGSPASGIYTPELDIIPDAYQTFKMTLSSDLAEKSLGIYRGEIEVNLPVTGYPNQVYYEQDGACIHDPGIKKAVSYRLKLFFKCRMKYSVKELSNFSIGQFKNGSINFREIEGAQGVGGNNASNVYLDNANNAFITYFSHDHQGFRFKEIPFKSSIVISELYVNRIYDSQNNLVLEEHYLTPFYLFDDFISYTPSVSQERFNLILKATGNKSWCFGTQALTANTFKVDTYNLFLQDDQNYNFFINSLGNLPLNDLNYFTFINGLYTGLIDPVNKLIYYILRDGSGYYLIDLNSAVDFDIEYFGFRNEDQLIVGYTDNNVEPYINRYKIINFKLMLDNLKLDKFIFEYSKIKFTFIPCQTRMLGKGGIITKV